MKRGVTYKLVYKKYIERNGKIYGPYVYNSKRVNGKVISEYIGAEEHKKKNIFPALIIASVFIIAALSFFIFLNHGISGNAVFNVQGKIINGSLSNGQLNFVLNEGELIPAGSQIIIENNGSSQTYNLSDLLSGNNISNGSFYLQGSSLSGSGKGYGLEGKETVYPTVNFRIELLNKMQNTQTNNSGFSGGSTQNNQSTVNSSLPASNSSNVTFIMPSNSTQKNQSSSNATMNRTTLPGSSQGQNNQSIGVQNKTGNQNPPKSASNSTINPSKTKQNETQISNSTPPAVSTSQITGSVISGKINTTPQNILVISGQASSGNNFIYNSSGKSGIIISGSVNSQGENLSDNEIVLQNTGKEIVVSTNYSFTQNGYGKNFLGQNTKTYSIDLSKLNKQIKEGTVTVKLIYNGNEIASFSQDISNGSLLNPNLSSNNTNLSINLTASERETLLSYINESSVHAEVSTYKDKYLVDLTYGPYSSEYSYSQNLNENELQSYIERDKTLWLKDIAASLTQTSPPRISSDNLSKNYSL